MAIDWLLIPSFFVIALVYASVGHGGASGYLAALSLLGFRPDEMAATALVLNMVVAGTALKMFASAGHLRGRLVWPFVVTSVPAAFLGGAASIPARGYAILLASALAVASWRLATERPGDADHTTATPHPALALPCGGGIGWLSGAVGIGGGIFLSPLLLFLRWATPKQAAAASAVFIFVNSAAGLGGRALRSGLEHVTVWPLLAAALVGGLCGARLGANHFSGRTLKRLLAVVLVVASMKLLMMAWRMVG